MSRTGEQFRKIVPREWSEVRRLSSPEVRLALLYLQTGQPSHSSGVYHLDPFQIEMHTGLNEADFLVSIRDGELAKFAMYDEETSEVFVFEMAATQIAQRLLPRDNRLTWLQKYLDADVRSGLILQRFRELYEPRGWALDFDVFAPNGLIPEGDVNPLQEPRTYAESEGASKPEAEAEAVAPAEAVKQNTKTPAESAGSSLNKIEGHRRHWEAQYSHEQLTKFEADAMRVVLADFHLGSEVVTMNGHEIGMALERDIYRDLLQTTCDPALLHRALPLVRQSQEFPTDTPMTLRLLKKNFRVVSDALVLSDKQQNGLPGLVGELVQHAGENMDLPGGSREAG